MTKPMTKTEPNANSSPWKLWLKGGYYDRKCFEILREMIKLTKRVLVHVEPLGTFLHRDFWEL